MFPVEHLILRGINLQGFSGSLRHVRRNPFLAKVAAARTYPAGVMSGVSFRAILNMGDAALLNLHNLLDTSRAEACQSPAGVSGKFR